MTKLIGFESLWFWVGFFGLQIAPVPNTVLNVPQP